MAKRERGARGTDAADNCLRHLEEIAQTKGRSDIDEWHDRQHEVAQRKKIARRFWSTPRLTEPPQSEVEASVVLDAEARCNPRHFWKC